MIGAVADDVARSLRSQAVVAARRQMLAAPHMFLLAQFVAGLRHAHSD